MHVVGCFDDRSEARLGPSNNLRLLGKLNELTDYVRTHGIDVIFIALPMRHLPRVVELIEALKDTTASVYYVPNMFVADLVQSRARTIQGIPVVALCETPLYGIHGVSKRLTDIVLASAILVLALPVMVLAWVLVKLSSPGPGVFAQRRYGLNGEEITIYKFRTMRVLEDGQQITQATRNDPRVTPIGRILRRYSIDELPQLINVLQGRMSLVGPRPHAIAHNEMYRKLIKGYMIRHKVRPGITGLAQVNGLRGETRTLEQMEARVRYDLEYVRTWSVGLDVQILIKTVVRVLVDGKAY
jgi:putative colanic acid biosynthesis UDP-glucose lipid carrier transferase